ncbi:SDR family oxidoreductase [bacterium]|nr:SDR family oxidoreductase [bacterium]
MVGVIGATGHLGNVLTRELIEQGFKVRAIIPEWEDVEPIEGVGVDVIRADVTDLTSITEAIQGVEYVFHCAGIISISGGNKKLMYRVNVEGTKNVIEACIKNKVKRLIYTSSVHALTEPPKGDITEETCKIDPNKVYGDYAKTKALATINVLEAPKRDLDTVVLCPSGIIGPFDYKISEMGQLILDFINRRLKVYIDGAYNFADVRDVAFGHIEAMKRGRCGEIYILGGEIISVYEILEILENITGIKKPRIKIPYWLAYITSPFTPIYYNIVKTKPLFTTYSIIVLRSNAHISSEKAIKELGYSFRPIKESIEDAYLWFRSQRRV